MGKIDFFGQGPGFVPEAFWDDIVVNRFLWISGLADPDIRRPAFVHHEVCSHSFAEIKPAQAGMQSASFGNIKIEIDCTAKLPLL